MSHGGKGDKPRPLGVSREVFDQRFETIFGKKEKQKENRLADKVVEQIEKSVMKDEYFRIED